MSRIKAMVIGMILAGATAALAQIAISQLPSAGLPLNGTEVVSGVQNGGTVKIPAWQMLSPYFLVTSGYPNVPAPYGFVVGSPSGGNMGAGTINVATAVYQNGSALGPSGYANAVLFTSTGNITAPVTPTRYYIAKGTPAATTITLPAASNFPNCPAVQNTCPVYAVKDFNANSGTYPITVNAADSAVFVAGNTIATSYVIQSNGAANNFVLVGASWSVE